MNCVASGSPLTSADETSMSSRSARGSSMAESGIECTWPTCGKTFKSKSDYNHHCKSHTRPFKCSTCTARHATKRQLDRHVNERHTQIERYYCTVRSCRRSMIDDGKPFPREDNCRKHMRNAHHMSEEQARICEMDEETKRIRRERKAGRRSGS